MANSSGTYLNHTVPAGISMFAPHISGEMGAVSSENPYATAAGLEILQAGGNAFDAAAAVSLALGVVDPEHSGIGGGCFSVAYHKNSDSFYCADGRGVAPKNAYETMFLNRAGEADPELTEYSGRSVAVPALYRALDTMLKTHGTMTLEQVSQPAIRLAKEGFRCGFVYTRISGNEQAKHNRAAYEGFSELYLNHGGQRRYGELVKNPDLARTMELVGKNGVDWFYNGPIADEVVAQVNRYEGLFCKEDMAECQVKLLEPVQGTYRGYKVVSMPPPSSGGTHVIQMLNILEQFDLKEMGVFSADYTHLLAEAMKMMFADRSVAMGDPAVVKIPLEKLLSKAYAKELAGKINMEKAQDFAPTEGIEAKEYDGCTSNFEVMDREGNIVVQTQTIRNWWGSGVVIPGRGFIMNNNMADFSAKAGSPNAMGLTYGKANAVRPGATPLSSMSPTIVFRDKEPVLAVGAAGGPRIITSTLQMILNVLDHGMMMDVAVGTPHLCCLSQDMGLELEYGFSPDAAKKLAAKGHKVVTLPPISKMLVLPNGIQKIEGRFFPCGSTRAGGGGGALGMDGFTAIEGQLFPQ